MHATAHAAYNSGDGLGANLGARYIPLVYALLYVVLLSVTIIGQQKSILSTLRSHVPNERQSKKT